MTKRQLFQRAFRDLWRLGHRTYGLVLLSEICVKSMQFLSFIYMSLFLDALIQHNSERITALLWQYFTLFIGLNIVNILIKPRVLFSKAMLYRRIESQLAEKMMRMQFQYAEDAKTHETLHYLQVGAMGRQSNLLSMNMYIYHLIEQGVRSVWAFVLLVPLIYYQGALPAPWTLLGSNWSLLVVVVAIIAVVALQIVSAQKTAKVFSDKGTDLQKVNSIGNYEFDVLKKDIVGQEIRQYNQIELLADNWNSLYQTIVSFLNEMIKAQTFITRFSNVVSQVLVLFTYLMLGARIIFGILPIGMIIQLSSALSQLLGSFPHILGTLLMMLSDPDILREYYEFMDLPEEEVRGSIPVEKRLDNDYALRVCDLQFAYPNMEQLVLKDINATFEVGKNYAIVGQNGSGKSTFVKLLMRLYEPTQGEVQLNRINTNKYQLREYFDLFSVVFQDFKLLGLTLGENIAVSPTYNTSQAMNYMEALGLQDFVEKLPQGLDTYLGTEFDPQGVALSGGQSQKVAIARAMYKDAPIMILDEPTAALDPISEFEVYQDFARIAKDKTAFFISHRLSSCRFCDEILVFDDGRIIQRGTHPELLSQEGKYAELWHAQAQYYNK